MDMDIKIAVRVEQKTPRIHFIDHSLDLAKPRGKRRLELIGRIVKRNIQEKLSLWNKAASKLSFRMTGMAIVFILIISGNMYRASGNSDVSILGSDSPEITTASGISVSQVADYAPAKDHEARILNLESKNKELGIKLEVLDKALGSPTESGFDGESLMESLATRNSQLSSINDQMKVIEDQNNAIIDFAVALNVKALVFKDKRGNIDLMDGKLEADSLAAGKFTVKVKDDGAATVGEATILSVKRDDNQDGIDDDTGSDGKSAVVKSKEMSNTAKIFVTPKAKEAIKSPLTVTAKQNGKSFTVGISDSASQDISFDWWILEENKN